MTRWQRLRKYELPIAMPVIVSGVRTSAVMIIGTATLAALIGAGGLGSFILLGIDRNNNDLILISAISSAVLALLFNWGIGWLEHRSLRTMLAALVALVVALTGSFVPQMVASWQHRETIVIAGKLGPEPEILMNMYAQLIEHDTDLATEVKPNFGKTTFVYEALKRGDVDIYPEFTGTITESLLETAPERSTDPATVYQQARDGILAQDDLVLLKPMAFQDTYAVAVTKDYAQQYGLSTISDLAKVQDSAVAGFTLEFNDRDDGGRGLKSLYGLDLTVKTMEPSLRYQAIAEGDVQIVDAYSTDAEISQYGLTVLEDDKQLFPPYQGAPLMKESLLKEHPELEATLNKLAGKITDDEMSRMNYEVKVEGKAAADVARDYLTQAGLLG
ncbi:ABC transporter permease/substrate-binding protein [Bifidobacterium choloepi]|uniref:ABC transporter permease/substrate-binding protein n=1 Tax=Bifidobacterium choloepi TaxID=2614131 RepID=UPI0022AB5AA8|nr:ABC transporter permease/substrate-binding protein [Bifidobacterium choloepi]